MTLSDYRIPASPCTRCGKRHDGAMEAFTDGNKPKSGDITICIYCANVMAFSADLVLRDLTPVEARDTAKRPECNPRAKSGARSYPREGGRLMRDLRVLDFYRCAGHPGGIGDETCGLFVIPSPIDRAPLRIIASCGDGWDHVSVSRGNRCPNWPEMEHARWLFFHDDETVMQLHVPKSQHINVHPNCLHLWRPQKLEIPRPPNWMVA